MNNENQSSQESFQQASPPFQVEVMDIPEIQNHSVLRHFAGKAITVKEVVPTKLGTAFRFNSCLGQNQVLEKFTVPA